MSFPTRGKVLFSATLVRGHIAKFHIPYLRWFKDQGWETWVAAKNDYPDGICEIPYCDHFVNIDFARSPFSKQTVVAYKQLRSLFENEHFDIVHTHTPVGGVLTRLAARDARRNGTKVIYTAHGFHFYNGAPFVNWALWYPVERVMSRFTDMLVTINNEDYKRAQNFAHCRVEYLPGVGIDLAKFTQQSDITAVRESLGLRQNDYFILAVGDLIKRKNHQSIIRALSILENRFKLYICGTGVEHDSLVELIDSLGLKDRVCFLGFRNDVAQLMASADVLVFPSIHEGLPVSVMEAMASGLPVIATNIRGIVPDLIDDKVNGLILENDQPDCIARAVQALANDEVLARKLSLQSREKVKNYSIDAVLRKAGKLYAGVLDS